MAVCDRDGMRLRWRSCVTATPSERVPQSSETRCQQIKDSIPLIAAQPVGHTGDFFQAPIADLG